MSTFRFALAVVFLGCVSSAVFGDDPATVNLRPALEFKDLTPPHHDSHGEKHVTCLPEEHHHAHEGGLFFTGEYLLLRPRRAGFDFAIADANRDLVPSGALQTLNYELRSGLRAGIGYHLPNTHWDARFEYTYLESGADRTIAAPPGGTLYATLTRAALNDEAAVATATAGMEYNVFDAILNRTLHLDEHSILRVFGGFRFATIRQNFAAAYNGGDANFGLVQTASNFDGFGPLIGTEIACNLIGGFHLFGRGNAALLTGSLRNPITETNNAGLTLYSNLDNEVRRVIPVLSLGIGGGWQYHNVTIRAGYEITNWFGLIDSPRFNGELSEARFATRSGDLSLEGLFAQIGFSY